MEMNLYIAAFVFSLHKAEPDKINPDVVNEMVTAVFDSPFMVKAHKNKKCTLFTDKVQDKKVKESIASQTSKFELDWKFHYEKGVDEFYNTYTECGICKLGKRENALNLFHVYAIWMREVIETMVGSYIVQKLWHREMIAVIFMLQR